MHAYLRGSLRACLAMAVVVHVVDVIGQQRDSTVARVAITFDDGVFAPFHAQLRQTVQQAGGLATFFVTGHNGALGCIYNEYVKMSFSRNY